MKVTLSTLLACIVLISCQQGKQDTAHTPVARGTLQPPMPGVDVPFRNYTVNAAKGDTLFYQSGSIILFPPNAFLDSSGKPVTGDVTVQYREFRDPADYYLAGIPMEYDSSNRKFIFRSSGMCDIHAWQNGQPLKVNPSHQPEINLVTITDSTYPDNLYYLDTTQGKWMYHGNAIITKLTHRTYPEAIEKMIVHPTPVMPVLVAPVKPAKASNKTPVITIEIQPGSFPELDAYNNLKFQVDNSEKHFNGNDTAEVWADMRLQKTNTEGLYTVSFKGAGRTVSYLVRPVVEGKDYEEALRVFEKQDALYKQQLNNRLTREQVEKAQLAKRLLTDSLEQQRLDEENGRTARLNQLVLDRIREQEAMNKRIAAENKEIATINSKTKEEQKAYQMVKDIYKTFAVNNVYKTFSINNFGNWNCDVPIAPPNTFWVKAIFKDVKSSKIEVQHIAVVYKSLYSTIGFTSNDLQLLDSTDHIIWGTVNGRFIYCSFAEYKKLGITRATKEKEIPMQFLTSDQNTYDRIKELLKE